MRLIDADAFLERMSRTDRFFGVAFDINDAPTVLHKTGRARHRRNLPNGLCYLYTEPYDNERGYKGEAVCVEPDDYCSCGERKTDG
mgnify:CR=1 FL=1